MAAFATLLLCGAGPITRVSVSATGAQGTNESYNPGWHPSGCCVVFYTQAPNLFATLPPNPTATQVALVNLATGAVTNMAPGTAVPGPAAINTYNCTLCKTHPVFSADGTLLAFYGEAANGWDPTDTGAFIDVFVETVATGAIVRISGPNGIVGNNSSYVPLLTPNGTLAAFLTEATNLLPGVTYRPQSLFAVDLATRGLTLLSVNASGTSQDGGVAEPSFSPSGTQIAYGSNATDLAPVPVGSTNIFVRSVAGGAATLISTTQAGAIGEALSTHPQWSPDGTRIAFQSDSVAFGGDGVTPQIYVKNLQTGALTLVSTTAKGLVGNGASDHPVFSPDGTKLAMDTAATNFALGTPAGTNQVAVKNLKTGALTVVSVTPAGAPGDGNSNHPQWSPNGKMIAFGSSSDNLVAGDTNRKSDVFVVGAP
jgi:Tol biopolymer transport system component